MKKKISLLLSILGLGILCAGCGSTAADGTVHSGFYWSYDSAIENMDNEYFKTKVLTYDKAGGMIIENEITEQKFLVIAGGQGIAITSIEENKNR